MLTIYKIEMDPKLGYWTATCEVDGRGLTVQAVAWVDFLTKDLMLLQVGGSPSDPAADKYLPAINKCIRAAVETRLAE